jgi:hypothetical protein
VELVETMTMMMAETTMMEMTMVMRMEMMMAERMTMVAREMTVKPSLGHIDIKNGQSPNDFCYYK